MSKQTNTTTTPCRILVPVDFSPPSRKAVAAASDWDADFLIAPHGHTGFKHLLVGSVAERVVQHAPCAVLVVRQPGGPEGSRDGKRKSK